MKWIKNFFYLSLLLLFPLVQSCSKDDDNNIERPQQEEPTRYYVKYEVTSTTQHVNVNRVVKFATEKGEESISLEERKNTVSWEGTYGPVQKGFVTSLDCSIPNYTYSSVIHARIYVSREKEPFVIKSEGEGKYFLQLSYKIDF